MEALVRVGTFLGVLTAMLLWEERHPRRPLARPRQERWVTNLGLTLLNTVLMRITVGGVAYTAAVFAAEQDVGLLHWHPLPTWAAAVVTLLVLDFAMYLQHVLFHAVPLLWRLHRVHHADLDVDATTGLRFHPLEILLSLGYKAAVIVVLGAVPWAVVAFEVLLNAASVFNHGNVALPGRLDRWLRWGIVTPDMHRVHHSTCVVETNANFGFAVSWWDRLCGTYRAQPALGQAGMSIGLREYRAPLTLGQLLLLPFRGSAGRSTYADSRPTRAPGGGRGMKPRVLRSGLVLLLAVGSGLAWWSRDQWTAEAIAAWVESLGVWGPLVFVGVYGLAPALFVPGAVLTLAGGALFGPILGALLSLAGATVGATVAFLIARYVAADWVERRLGKRMQALKTGVEHEGWRFVAFVRLVPVFPFTLLNYALGLTRLSVRTFAVTSLLTMAPGALAYAYLGYTGREVVSGGSALVHKGFLALTLLAAVALLPVLIRHWRRPGKPTLRRFHYRGARPTRRGSPGRMP